MYQNSNNGPIHDRPAGTSGEYPSWVQQSGFQTDRTGFGYRPPSGAKLLASLDDKVADADAKLRDFMAEIESLESDVTTSSDIDSEPLPRTSLPGFVSAGHVLPPTIDTTTELSVHENVASVELDEPTTCWQHLFDENTQHYYYWNTETNAVTWTIPPDYTDYLLRHKLYREALAAGCKTMPKISDQSMKLSTESSNQPKLETSTEQAELKTPEIGPQLPSNVKQKQQENADSKQLVDTTNDSTLVLKQSTDISSNTLGLVGYDSDSAEEMETDPVVNTEAGSESHSRDNSAVETRDEYIRDGGAVETQDEYIRDDGAVKIQDEYSRDNSAVETRDEYIRDGGAVETRDEYIRDDGAVKIQDEYSRDDGAVETRDEYIRDANPAEDGLDGGAALTMKPLVSYPDTDRSYNDDHQQNGFQHGQVVFEGRQLPVSGLNRLSTVNTVIGVADNIPLVFNKQQEAPLIFTGPPPPPPPPPEDEAKPSQEHGLSSAEISEYSTDITDKLHFLDVTTEGITKLQMLLVQLKTRLDDWQAGGLNKDYLIEKIQEADGMLEVCEMESAPAGWKCNWSRKEKQYYYIHEITEELSWSYPKEDEDAVRMLALQKETPVAHRNVTGTLAQLSQAIDVKTVDSSLKSLFAEKILQKCVKNDQQVNDTVKFQPSSSSNSNLVKVSTNATEKSDTEEPKLKRRRSDSTEGLTVSEGEDSYKHSRKEKHKHKKRGKHKKHKTKSSHVKKFKHKKRHSSNSKNHKEHKAHKETERKAKKEDSHSPSGTEIVLSSTSEDENDSLTLIDKKPTRLVSYSSASVANHNDTIERELSPLPSGVTTPLSSPGSDVAQRLKKTSQHSSSQDKVSMDLSPLLDSMTTAESQALPAAIPLDSSSTQLISHNDTLKSSQSAVPEKVEQVSHLSESIDELLESIEKETKALKSDTTFLPPEPVNILPPPPPPPDDDDSSTLTQTYSKVAAPVFYSSTSAHQTSTFTSTSAHQTSTKGDEGDVSDTVNTITDDRINISRDFKDQQSNVSILPTQQQTKVSTRPHKEKSKSKKSAKKTSKMPSALVQKWQKVQTEISEEMIKEKKIKDQLLM